MSGYPAGAEHDSRAPYNEKDYGDCHACSGDGEVCYTCNNIKSQCTCNEEDQFLLNCAYCKGTGKKSEDDVRDEYESFKEDTRDE